MQVDVPGPRPGGSESWGSSSGRPGPSSGSFGSPGQSTCPVPRPVSGSMPSWMNGAVGVCVDQSKSSRSTALSHTPSPTSPTEKRTSTGCPDATGIHRRNQPVQPSRSNPVPTRSEELTTSNSTLLTWMDAPLLSNAACPLHAGPSTSTLKVSL